VFRDGTKLNIQSKSGQPLGRYFPELVVAFQAVQARKFVLDGEILIPFEGDLSFERLLMRIHPAESRIAKLSRETPAWFLAFDLLVDGRGKSWVGAPLGVRRKALEAFARSNFTGHLRLSPMTLDFTEAREWFARKVGLDGVIAKRRDAKYQAGERGRQMLKIKKLRTADCVIGGFRYASKRSVVGALLLGLYDRKGLLNHVGFTSGFSGIDRAELTRKLEGLIKEPGFTGRAPGGPSRWSTERSGEWQPLRPKLVVEVQFDHFTGGRFRHGTKLLRWRPDKSARRCTMAQVEAESRSVLDLL